MDDGGQTQYYAYYPFGELIESSGSHGTEFQFTGKERDKHVDFELDYFGARYYDPRVGSFTTIDKASQFASGYVYGANNPLIGVDPDGNWFSIDDLIIAGVAFTVGYIQHGVQTGNWGGDAFKAGAVAAGSAWLAYNTGRIAGNQLKAIGAGRKVAAVGGATAGGAVGGASSVPLAQYAERGALKDIGKGEHFWRSVGRSSLAGAAGGFAGGTTAAYLSTNPVTPGVVGGAVAGGVQGSYEGNWLLGALKGGTWGATSSILTYGAYERYGGTLAERQHGEGTFGQDIAPDGNDGYYCHEYTRDLTDPKTGKASGMRVAEFYNNGRRSHSGVVLGGDLYGNDFILSKEGPTGPTSVLTGRQLGAANGTFVGPGWYPPPPMLNARYFGGYGEYIVIKTFVF